MTKPGRRRRSSGGYPVTASSGKTTRSAPARAGLADRVDDERSRLPARSPTTASSWASASLTVVLVAPRRRVSRESLPHAPARRSARCFRLQGINCTLPPCSHLSRSPAGSAGRARRRTAATPRGCSPRRSVDAGRRGDAAPAAAARAAARRDARRRARAAPRRRRARRRGAAGRPGGLAAAAADVRGGGRRPPAPSAGGARPSSTSASSAARAPRETASRSMPGAFRAATTASSRRRGSRARSAPRSCGPRSTARAPTRCGGRAAASRCWPGSRRASTGCPTEGERCVVVGWPLDEDGRKRHAATALYGEDGAVLAVSRQLWIEPRGS